jgi:hypothetical protein
LAQESIDICGLSTKKQTEYLLSSFKESRKRHCLPTLSKPVLILPDKARSFFPPPKTEEKIPAFTQGAAIGSHASKLS